MFGKYTYAFILLIAASIGVYITRGTVFGGQEGPFSITSPLPAILSKAFPQVLGESNVWRPNTDSVYDKGIEKPQFTSSAVVSYDLTTNRLLFEKNSNKRLPMASLTKIMTAIVALENMNIDDEVVVKREAATVGENAMGLTEGEKVKVEDLLYGLILPSGNDAAEALAYGSKFDRETFIYQMNKKAEDLGLSNTRFTNPSGLEGDGNQYSTAYDLLIMTEYALRNPTFAEVVATYEYYIPYSSKHKEFMLYNDTNLLTTYPGVKGVKTGFTNEAGMCLVTYLEYKGHRIIAVLLNSQNRRQEMKNLLDYSLKTLGVEPPPHP